MRRTLAVIPLPAGARSLAEGRAIRDDCPLPPVLLSIRRPLRVWTDGREGHYRAPPVSVRSIGLRLERERLLQDDHSALLNGDRRAREREIGDRRCPVGGRAARVRRSGLRRRLRRHVEGEVAVLDLTRRDRLTPGAQLMVTDTGRRRADLVRPLCAYATTFQRTYTDSQGLTKVRRSDARADGNRVTIGF